MRRVVAKASGPCRMRKLAENSYSYLLSAQMSQAERDALVTLLREPFPMLMCHWDGNVLVALIPKQQLL